MWEEVRPGRCEGVGGGGDASGMCTGRARLKAVGARARTERTLNIWYMLVTSDVSKLSDWLNANADASGFCRVERRTCNVGSGTAREA